MCVKFCPAGNRLPSLLVVTSPESQTVPPGDRPFPLSASMYHKLHILSMPKEFFVYSVHFAKNSPAVCTTGDRKTSQIRNHFGASLPLWEGFAKPYAGLHSYYSIAGAFRLRNCNNPLFSCHKLSGLHSKAPAGQPAGAKGYGL